MEAKEILTNTVEDSYVTSICVVMFTAHAAQPRLHGLLGLDNP